MVNIVENTVCHKNDDTERADNLNRVELPAISEAMNSATRLYNLHPKPHTSDNLKIAKSFNYDSGTPSTINHPYSNSLSSARYTSKQNNWSN